MTNKTFNQEDCITISPDRLGTTPKWQVRRYDPDPSKVLVIDANGGLWVFDGKELSTAIEKVMQP